MGSGKVMFSVYRENGLPRTRMGMPQDGRGYQI
jgi:hypothetical protein